MKLSGDGDDFQGKKAVVLDNAVKNGYGFVGGLSVTELRRTRLSMVLFRRRRGGGGQVEAVTTRDALMEQISPRVEPASSTRYPTGSCGF
ncbi:hypothetical protein F2Q70_00026311 [Brassica cretica]|uniref:Uncharacterized protein n=1 Tax=Brassica cretica TaxID=69181 RepID=A0A8S9IFA7_BRACR|nr:hypothetical protein F2Q68_00025870 [Brassica cretica]KAF2603559.1 hypothetical protein F2Q70_00026311 [Brassica cretica]